VDDSTDRDPPHRARRPFLVVLWIIVSTPWTVATCLRVLDVWVPAVGWPVVLSSVFTWVSLLGPPLTFAIVLMVVSRIAAAHHGSGWR
jgi:hypothetical protein